MTSNIGAEFLLEGITDHGAIRDDARETVMKSLRAHFRPEFLNRVDEIVFFKPLLLEEITRIVDLLVDQLRARLADRRITLELDTATKEYLARNGYDPVYGARPLKRFIQRELETRIGRELIKGRIPDGSVVTVGLDGDQIAVRTAPSFTK